MIVRILPMPDDQAQRAAAPLPDSGIGCLRTESGNLPLEALDVSADITGLVSRVTMVQTFRNPHAVPLEATYIFPLPDRAAVTRMRMTADDRVVEAELQERAQARETYDRAVAAGQRASIAEEDRPDVFTMRVGNIVPGERVTVELTLAGPLLSADGSAEFRFPLVVAPRYVPGVPLGGPQAGDGVNEDTDAVPDASRISPPVLLPGFPDPVRLSIDVGIDPAGLPLGDVRCSLHALSEVDGRWRILPGERADRDFVLRLAYGAPATAPAVQLCPDADSDSAGTFELTVLPPLGAAPPRPRDVVLVLDRSGSMGGWKMISARRAAARIVDTLTDADRFAVLTFDHHVDRPAGLSAGLVPASDRNRFRAVQHLSTVDARGGTEMLAPLTQGRDLLTATDGERDRVLVLLTDGQVGNEDQILRTLGTLNGIRVHAIGIDRAVNAGFLGRLAAAGGGVFELVETEDRLDEVMANIHRRIGSPLVTDLSLEPLGLTVEPGTVAPARLPDLFPGVPLVIRGRYSAHAAGAADAAVLRVRGRAADGGAWDAEPAATRHDNPAVTSVWARAHLRDLEDAYLVGADPGRSSLERRIVDTSLRFGVLCRFTAYVAVDPRVVAEGGPGHRVVQPVEPVDGWDNAAGPTMTLASFSAPAPRETMSRKSMRLRGLTGGASPAAARYDGTPPPPPRVSGYAADSTQTAAGDTGGAYGTPVPPPNAQPGAPAPFPTSPAPTPGRPGAVPPGPGAPGAVPPGRPGAPGVPGAPVSPGGPVPPGVVPPGRPLPPRHTPPGGPVPPAPVSPGAPGTPPYGRPGGPLSPEPYGPGPGDSVVPGGPVVPGDPGRREPFEPPVRPVPETPTDPASETRRRIAEESVRWLADLRAAERDLPEHRRELLERLADWIDAATADLGRLGPGAPVLAGLSGLAVRIRTVGVALEVIWPEAIRTLELLPAQLPSAPFGPPTPPGTPGTPGSPGIAGRPERRPFWKR
ncbi:hypothetical protein Val02_46230 [Virgisporangium aliadipatigenens]|uniref:Ca-activated chloride channel family protein n=1 Tax=Virgisporangium aliadipatigenens TaxID=741659 RepID=A0A8J3YNS2_9ACTN|nr:VIT domain-containing protein [Virgisporangium aliadipatigenens]GIJ47737.1 hypothetical protein Val02_46230 [Virgisporangium aliadipatigenens]